MVLLAGLIICVTAACCPALPTPTPEPTATATATATWTPMPPVPTATNTPRPTATPTPTATPRFVLLPSVEALANQVAEKHGWDFTYIKYHFVPADSEIWICYGWPEKDEHVYRAVFRWADDEWKLMETKPMETPTPTPSPTPTQGPGGEAMRW